MTPEEDICHVFQTDDEGSEIPICGIRDEIRGGLHLSDGMNYHKGGKCSICDRVTCPTCDEGAKKIKARLKLAKTKVGAR